MPNRLRRPDPDQPHLREWFDPLHRFAARVRFEDLPFDVRTDEFTFVGWLRRPPRPTLHFYEHPDRLAGLVVDDEGLPYRQARNRSWLRARSLRAACWGADLPYLPAYRRPSPSLEDDDWSPVASDACSADDAVGAAPGERPMHLRLLVWGDVEE